MKSSNDKPSVGMAHRWKSASIDGRMKLDYITSARFETFDSVSHTQTHTHKVKKLQIEMDQEDREMTESQKESER